MLNKLGEIVKDVGQQLIKWRDEGRVAGVWDGTQFKAEADMLAHNLLVKKIKAAFSDIPIISEEDNTHLFSKRPQKYWLVDPIDGTASFAQGYQGFVTQVALVEGNTPTVAAIYAPVFDLCYLSRRGQGVFVNGKRLNCTDKKEVNILIDNYPQPRGITLAAYNELRFDGYIECGSISLKICKVADGTASLFFKDVIVRDWDLAAPQVVLEEAGKVLTDINGERFSYTGTYERKGVVAAASKNTLIRLVNWYSNRAKFES